MKKMFFLATLAVAVLAFTACGHKAEMAAAKAISDSLQMEVQAKDSLLNDAFGNIEEIATALSQISEREKIVASTSAGEINKSAKERISENIAAISELLQQNRAAINRLSASARQLKAANVKIAALESLVASLEQQMADKDKQIEKMAQELENLQIEVAELKDLNATLSGQKNQLESTVAQQTEALNTVYYIVGQDRELTKSGIVDKKGFIGRTAVLGKNADMKAFTQADLRQLDRIEIGQKGVKLVSAHPAESYVLVKGDKNTVTELVISDKKAFWSASKVLVVSYR